MLFWHFVFPDVDECADNLHFCDASANCTNTIGYYRCVCNPPHYGDQGEKYINISECIEPRNIK